MPNIPESKKDDELDKTLEYLLIEYCSVELLQGVGKLLKGADGSASGHTLRQIGIAIEALAEIEY